jgi:hypothetical protein
LGERRATKKVSPLKIFSKHLFGLTFSNIPSSQVVKLTRFNLTVLLVEMTGWYGNKGSFSHGS